MAPCPCRRPAPPTSLVEIGVPRIVAENARFDYFDELSDFPSLGRAKRRLIEWSDAWPDVPAGVVLTGPCGVGKTHLAVSALRRLLLERRIAARARFVYVPQLLRELRGSWKDPERTEEGVLAGVTGADIVVFDGLGEGMGQSWAEEQLLYILKRCFGDGGRLICTTVYPLSPAAGEKALGELITVRAVSVLREACQFVRMLGNDYRDTVLSPGLGV